jgi:hypothetical protein
VDEPVDPLDDDFEEEDFEGDFEGDFDDVEPEEVDGEYSGTS